MIHHECSVAAVYDLDSNEGSNTSVFRMTVRMLLDMQTRGQLAAGVSSYSAERPDLIKTFKATGSVDRVFDVSRPQISAEIEEAYDGTAIIGHTRYATIGGDDDRYAQPVERRHGQLWKWFAFAFNGTLTNHSNLRDKLADQKNFHFVLDSDTEVIEHYLAHNLSGDTMPNLEHVMQNLSELFDGSYCIVMLDAAGRMIVARDPLGLRPLNWAQQDGLFAAASESSALQNAGFRDVYAVAPGEIIIVGNGEITRSRYVDAPHRAHCFFEWVYFANVASSIDGRGVYESRATAGKILAQREDIAIDNDTIVVPVPDTAKAAADSFAYHLGIPCVEGVFRNRFVGRTFIQAAQSRADAASSKYTPLPSVLRGKKVFLVEDSIVRSTTLKALVSMIEARCRPKEIHVRVASPPIVAPCFYGIDLSTIGELFAAQYEHPNEMQDDMAETFGVDSLRYLSPQDIAECIGIENESLCSGCVTGKYPTPAGNALYKQAKTDREGMRTFRG